MDGWTVWADVRAMVLRDDDAFSQVVPSAHVQPRGILPLMVRTAGTEVAGAISYRLKGKEYSKLYRTKGSAANCTIEYRSKIYADMKY